MATVQPHILRRTIAGDWGEAVTVPADPGRALLVLPSEAAAESFGELVGFDLEAITPVAPEDIERVCAGHDLALVGLYGFAEPGQLDILSVEMVEEVFEELD